MTVIKFLILAFIVVAISSIALVLIDNRINSIEKSSQAAITANTVKHNKDVARLKAEHKKDIAKTKMKERSKRWFASIPIIGTVLLFRTGKDEYDDYEEWKKTTQTVLPRNTRNTKPICLSNPRIPLHYVSNKNYPALPTAHRDNLRAS